MKLCIDNREYLRIPLFQEYIKSGKTLFIDGIELGNFEVADIHTPDLLVGIEYKKDDLLTSIYDGRLDKQLKELKDTFQYPFLFIGYDGVLDTISNNIGTNPDIIIGKFCSILSREKVSIIFVGDFLVPITVGTIERFYDAKTPIKLTDYTPIRNRPKKKKPTIDEIRRHLISDIPRVGPLKGDRLLKKFGTPLGISNATVEQLMEIDGIGEKLANDIKRILT